MILKDMYSFKMVGGSHKKSMYFYMEMRQNFTARVSYDGRTVLATVLPEHRKDGMYYEINIPGIERFYMHWSVMDRYDVVAQPGLKIPDNLLFALGDILEERFRP